MKRPTSLLIFITVLVFNCAEKKTVENETTAKVFDSKLADELKAMAVTDQIAAYIRQGEYTQWDDERWNNFKDSVFRPIREGLRRFLLKWVIPDLT